MYDYQTLTLTNVDGSISPFSNGASGYVLLGGGTSVLPSWSSLADANIASLTDLQGYLPLAGGTLTGNLILETGLSVTAPSFIGDLTGTASKARKWLLGDTTARNNDSGENNIDSLNANGLFKFYDIVNANWMDNGVVMQFSNQDNPIPGTSGHEITQIWSTAISSGAIGVRWRDGTGSWTPIETILTSPSGVLSVSKGGTGKTTLTSNQILLGNGSNGISSIAITNNDKGKVLRYTTSGTYDWVSVSSLVTVPAINQLACADSASDNYGQNDNQRVLFRNTAYNGTPTWRLIHETDIYGAPDDDLSVLANYKGSGGPSEGGTSYSNSTWVGVNESEVTSAPKMLAAKYVGSDSSASLDFFSASELGLLTSIPAITGLASGSQNEGYLLSVGSASSYTPTWIPRTDLNIPSAPSSLPLVDNETGSLGTSGTYATADHQHPLPYAVQAAYKFYYPRKLGIGGAITAEAQEYDGTSDLILQVTEIDPAAIINTVPIEKGGTGATTASAALTNLGAAASNHNHDGTYLKLSGGSSQAMTGALYFNSALSTAIVAPGMGEGIVTVGSNGAFSSASSVNSYVTGRRNNINLYDADVSATAGTPTDINHVAKNDTTVNIVCGSSATRAYTRYINLPTPTADMLGDTITIYFTNQKPAVTGNLWVTCSTDERIMDYRYEHFKNAETTGWKNCSWANGNVVQFTCIKLESTGTTYYWRAVKLVEQSW
jgi:hypothetical protein